MIDISSKVEARKAAYEKLPRTLRAMIISLAFAVGISGSLLVFTPPPIFDIGVLLLLLSLSVLSFQFTWARTTLIYITNKLSDKSFRKKLFTIVTALTLVLLGIWLFNR